MVRDKNSPKLHLPATEFRPGDPKSIVPLKIEGAGNAGRFARTHSLRKRKHAAKSPQVRRKHSAFPARMVLTVSFVLAPETGLSCLRRRVMRSIIACLTSASGCQAHTTSPSAFSAFVLCATSVHRIPRPTFCDDRETPLFKGTGRARSAGDLGDVNAHACDTLARRANQFVALPPGRVQVPAWVAFFGRYPSSSNHFVSALTPRPSCRRSSIPPPSPAAPRAANISPAPCRRASCRP